MHAKKEVSTIALVTGATGGLGQAFLRCLLREPELTEIWALARSRDKLEALRKTYGPKICTYALDLSRKEDILRFADVLREKKPRIRYLINNAGYAKFGSYHDLSVDDSLNMIDLNCGGVVAMGLICLPYMRRGDHLLNLASQASFQPLPYQNLYSSTKAFVRNYSRALGVELRDRGITVTAVCPGWIDTGLYARAQIGAKKATNRFCGMVPPDPVARKALRDAKHGRDISVYSLYVKTAHLLAKVLPQRAMMEIWLRQQHLQ